MKAYWQLVYAHRKAICSNQRAFPLVVERTSYFHGNIGYFLRIKCFIICCHTDTRFPIYRHGMGEIEDYPEEGTEEEKQEWEEGKIAWEDMLDYFDEMMGFFGWTAFHSGLLAIIGIFSAFLLWTNRQAGIKAVGLWIVINFVGGIWMMWRMSEIGFTPIDDYGQEAGGTMIPDLINQFSMIMGVGQIALCNGFLLALLVLVASKSKPETTIDIPSGFR